MDTAPDPKSSLTPMQRQAVEARGNVLVMAGAGTGKTKTLVERCIDCLARDGASVDEMLIVTFTEAAAAEMRERLRAAIEQRASDPSPPAPSSGDSFWPEQLARFDLAHIGTLHSFCLRLVREHFYELELDPRLAVLDEGQAAQLAMETLDQQFQDHYAGEDPFSLAVQDLIQAHGGGRDESIRRLVLQLHRYSQARPDATGWLGQQRQRFSSPEPADWRRWLPEAIARWRDEWLPILQTMGAETWGAAAGNEKAVELAGILSKLNPAEPLPAGEAEAGWRQAAAKVLAELVDADLRWPARRKTVLRKPLEDIFEAAAFLHSLAAVKNGVDPLEEDWAWIRGHMETLLRLAEGFNRRLADAKRANGTVDFQDLEQLALKLLWQPDTAQPTAVAESWRAKLKFVFVDEYQDINAAQDRIIQGLSRPGSEGGSGNRFLVGDVKQSIYRFRLADPAIFREYARQWNGPGGQTIPLSQNFRSREDLLDVVNGVFRAVMRPEVGGVAYDREAELTAGPSPMRDDPLAKHDAKPHAELLVRIGSRRNEGREEDSDIAVVGETQREARLVAWRLRQLVANHIPIFDDATGAFRPVEWRDMAILLRSPRGRSEVFAKEFESAGIPLAVARGGFFESAEILDLLSLLQLLDNPLQDVPCIAVLRSPLVGLSLDELAEIRLAAREKHFWTALVRSQSAGADGGPAKQKVSVFLERFSRWRRLAKLVSLSQCLEEVLAETLYADWLRAQPRGAQRAANVDGFLQMAQQFDQFQRQGLFRFLRFIEAQQGAEAEPEVPPVATENAVRLMSIHQSKGLEFPVVVVADLAKRFNEQDLRGDIIFDEELGLCPKVKPPHTGRRYPSLTHWLAQRRQRHELRGEELRLLYVAMTRARDHLILTASLTEKNWLEQWTRPQLINPRRIAGARCLADWLALWFSNAEEVAVAGVDAAGATEGMAGKLRWRVVPDEKCDSEMPGMAQNGQLLSEPAPGTATANPTVGGVAIAVAATDATAALRTRLEWEYPFAVAARRKAKASVTALRREAEELDDEAAPVFPGPAPRRRLRGATGGAGLSAAEIGEAHHQFMEWLDLGRANDVQGEADRLVREGYLTGEERAVLDLEALQSFWRSDLGQKICSHAGKVRRELPFTARFSPLELAEIIGAETAPGLAREFVVVQGVADLVVLQPEEIWLVDFKTDSTAAEADRLAEKVRLYSPQLELYARALEKIFQRKVTVRALHFLAARHTELL